MNENKQMSRVEKYRKRRNLNRSLLILFILGFLIIIILVSLIVSNNRNKEDLEVSSNDQLTSSEQDEGIGDKDIVNEDNIQSDFEDDNETNIEEDDSIFIDYVESSDDNVIEAYIGNWAPVGTVQQGPHTTNFNDGSDDRIEIKRAVSEVTEIDESDMVEWRVENGGEQKVISTVSDKNETEIFRIYLTWINEQGWQVTKVEKLKENDKK